MAKIKYNGNLNPCNVSAKGNLYTNWYVGEVRDLPSSVVDKIILDNSDFVLVQKESSVVDSKISDEPISELSTKSSISNINSFSKRIKK